MQPARVADVLDCRAQGQSRWAIAGHDRLSACHRQLPHAQSENAIVRRRVENHGNPQGLVHME